jgi:hypothetical protein
MIISRESLMSLETYSKQRNDFRKQVIEHKKIVPFIWVITLACCLKMN